jgi:RHS repeat-associated protein
MLNFFFNIRKILLWVFLLCSFRALTQPAVPAAYSASARINYVRTWSAAAPDASASNLITRSPTDVIQSTQYYDGFGRPLQSVTMKASPAGNDVVEANYYDAATGNEKYKYLPFVSNVATAGDVTNNGNFKLDRFQQQVAFFNTYLAGQANETSASANTPNWAYNQVDYELSPLNRVKTTYAPGYSWVGSARSANIQYLINTSLDNVQKWNIAAWDKASPQASIIPTNGGTYNANELYKTISTDEKNLQTVEFKDRYGQVILKKNQLTASDAGTGSPHNGWACTYYVYDDYGSLRFVVTPKAVALIDGTWAISQTLADDLCYRYEYDKYGRSVVKKSPGAGEEWSVYDNRGRLVMSQDANMRQPTVKKWQYYTYEGLDRLKTTGLMTDPTNYASLSTHLDNAVAAGAADYPVLSGYTTEVLSESYYDNYDWSTAAGMPSAMDETNILNTTYFYTASNAAAPYPQSIKQSKMIRGSVTGSKTEVLNSAGTQYLFTVSFYDDKGRVLQTQGTNITGAAKKDISTTQFSWNGKPLRILEQHSKGQTNPQDHTVLTKMTYDFAGRLLNTTKQITSSITNTATSAVTTINNPEKKIASFTYDESGQVKTKTIGTLPGTDPITGTPIETLTYDYNIRGWVTGINKNFTQSAAVANYFGMELAYDKQTSANVTTTYLNPSYNGNIAGVIWKSKGDAVPRKYDFTYDNLNQLKTAAFLQNTSGTVWDKTYIDYSVNNINYDLNGNITALNQNGFVLGGVTSNIDNLSYKYINDNSNRLQNVIDNGNVPQSKLGDFHYAVAGKTAATTVDYGYDLNGNVISDANKNITSITYNVLNLPLLITTPKGTISYIYDAAGNKLKKTTTENNVSITLNGATTTNNTITTITTYIGGFIYQSKNFAPNTTVNTTYGYTETLQCMLHEEGRARIVTPLSGTSSFAFDYFIRDHLGNVRATVTDEGQKDYYYAATVEAALSAKIKEAQYYNIIDDANHIVPVSSLGLWYTNATGSGYPNNNAPAVSAAADPTIGRTGTTAYLYKLRGATGTAGDRHGLNMTLKVTAGDIVNIYGKSLWHSNSPLANDAPHALSTVLTDFINVFAGTGAVTSGGKGTATGTILNGSSTFTTPLSNYIGTVPTPATTPKAYINYIFFDEQFKLVAITASQFDPVGAADQVKTHAIPNIVIPKSGYLYIYCSNESNQDIYFDNLQVTHQRSQLIQEQHYYPGGLSMAGISSSAFGKLATSFGYQGKEIQAGEFWDGSGLDEYDFEARYYDQQLMRWHNVDPVDLYGSPYTAMNNNPVSITDPDGKCPVCLIVGAVIGAAINVATHWDAITANGSVNWGAFASAAVVGGVAGAIGAFTGGAAFAAAGTGGALGGAFSGFVGSAVSSPILGIGNGIAFGDGYSLGGWARDAVFGGITGGAVGGVTSSLSGKSFWNGNERLPNLPEKIAAADVKPITPDDVKPTTSSQPQIQSMSPQPEWGMGPSPRGFAIEKITMDRYYKGWVHLPRAPTIDGLNATASVSIKSTMSTSLNVSKNIIRLSESVLGLKIMHIVIPPGHTISNLANIAEQCKNAGIRLILTYH